MLGLAIESANQMASAALWSNVDLGSNADEREAGADHRPSVDRGAEGADCGAGERHDLTHSLLAIGTLPPETGKADQLISVIERLLGERGLDYSDLDVIAVNRGPGSFTGIRSAVALARGLALATGLPVLGITSHEALATGLGPSSGRVSMIALDARRGEVYSQAFAADGHPLCDIEAKAPALIADDLKSGAWRLAGSGAALVAAELADDLDVEIIATPPVDAGMVALAASIRLSRGETPAPGFDLEPHYIRAPDAVPPTPLISKIGAYTEAPV